MIRVGGVKECGLFEAHASVYISPQLLAVVIGVGLLILSCTLLDNHPCDHVIRPLLYD